MNLLVTNTRNAQSYAIIRALRPHSQKIVVTMYGRNRISARLSSHAANSRLVDKRYRVPSPVEDWRAGRIQRENTEREETYIQAILQICEREQIDAIFPSFDPQVYLFSKNRQRFEKIGVLIPVPDYETLITPLDKYRTIQAAQEVGFPCPRTYLPESENDLRGIGAELGFPLVLKRRFTSAGRGMELVRSPSDLSERTNGARGNAFILQEYIPGNQKQHFCLLLDKDGLVKAAFCPRIQRNFFRIYANFPTAYESSGDHPYIVHATRLLRSFGWWGGTTIETKIDPRDATPKLMEINPRLGYPLLNRIELGINEPLMCLQVAAGEKVNEAWRYPTGVLLINLVEDILGFGFKVLDALVYKFRGTGKGKAGVDPFNPPMTVKEIIESYARTYRGGKKRIFDQYCRYFCRDPLVSFLWWLAFLSQVVRAAKQLGR